MKKILVIFMFIMILSFGSVTHAAVNFLAGEGGGGDGTIAARPDPNSTDLLNYQTPTLSYEQGLPDSILTNTDTDNIISSNGLLYLPIENSETSADYCDLLGLNWDRVGYDYLSHLIGSQHLDSYEQSIIDYDSDLLYASIGDQEYNVYEIYDSCQRYEIVHSEFDFDSSYIYTWNAQDNDIYWISDDTYYYISLDKIVDLIVSEETNLSSLEKTGLDSWLQGVSFGYGAATTFANLTQEVQAALMPIASLIITLTGEEMIADWIRSGQISDFEDYVNGISNFSAVYKIKFRETPNHYLPFIDLQARDWDILANDTTIPVYQLTFDDSEYTYGSITITVATPQNVYLALQDSFVESMLDQLFDLFD